MTNLRESLGAFKEGVAKKIEGMPVFVSPLTPDNAMRAEYIKYLLSQPGPTSGRRPNLLLVANHGEDNDGFALGNLAYWLMAEGSEGPIIPASSSRHESSPMFRGVLDAFSWMFGAQIVPVVQGRQLHDLHEKIKNADSSTMRDSLQKKLTSAEKIIEDYKQKVRESAQGENPVSWCIFPEGTRSRNGKLRQYKPGQGDGFNEIVRLMGDTIIVPIGLTLDEHGEAETSTSKKHRVSFAFGRMRAEVGFPLFSLADNEITYDDVMTQVAALVPTEMRGDWQARLDAFNTHLGPRMPISGGVYRRM